MLVGWLLVRIAWINNLAKVNELRMKLLLTPEEKEEQVVFGNILQTSTSIISFFIQANNFMELLKYSQTTNKNFVHCEQNSTA